MNKNEVTAELYRQQFAVEVSKRYHAHRIDSIRLWACALQGVELVASTSALVSTFAWSVTVTRGLILVAGLSAGLALVKRLADAEARHHEKKAAFGELSKRFPADLSTGTEALLEEVLRERREIEKDDTAGFQCLDVACHNEECFARGLHGDMQPLTWAQRNLGAILPLRYRPRPAAKPDA
ncbi:MAG: hypothetical protein ACOX9C_04315 [Kiritimatiellia bacterium]|jgi:poly(3-hydroxybutyrate) depolymerase